MKKRRSSANKTENIFLLVLIGILFVCFIVIGLLFYKYFYAGAGNDKYGDRLDGIENYPISEELESQINELYKESDGIKEVKIDVIGKVIYLNYNFTKSVKVETAQSLAVKAIDAIGEENCSFYDIQFILKYTGEEENENFPIFGSKNSNSLKVVW